MKVLIASDSFKGSLSSEQIGKVGASALRKAMPEMEVNYIILADGGEGTVEALVTNTGGELISKEVTGPLGQKVIATYGMLGDGVTAVIEMASASGIMLQDREELDPMRATSYGTGELIMDAIERGATKVIMGIGGSATNDGGMGMLSAMGFQFKDENGDNLRGCGADMIRLKEIVVDNMDPRLKDVTYTIACDVQNPLVGEHGATYTYGPQKGAGPEQLTSLEAGMTHYGEILEKSTGKSLMTIPGTGAAGGLGVGLLGYFGARLVSGFDLISETIGLKQLVQDEAYDLIITGEGQINHQTPHGKLPSGVAAIGKAFNIPVIAVVGGVETGFEELYDHGLFGVMSIVNKPMSLDYAIDHAEELVHETYFNIGKMVQGFMK